ncbi:Cupin domain-containing protein [Kaistia soli DSM 19436]|uniref:Cupin domain-containing protein n=1 Tax=Kaistia soli DSM 19436 TaxID=1122133 RepID=A0A1M5I9R1_9HYPH|nr:cupin domain-containing protein [Kaistia soli]SHG24991.1 Cupin domain-containing protein [Kaistia soli DSM 19436]
MRGTFRRIVTGHDEVGRAVILSDAPPTRSVLVGGPGGATFFEIWNTGAAPPPILRHEAEPDENGLVLAPPTNGTRIRIIDFPPEGDAIRLLGAAGAQAAFGAMGGGDASRFKTGAHPLMHRTETIDYGIVLDGEMTLVLDASETLLHAGDVVIQRGTSHAWSNRSDTVCRMAFVLIDGRYAEGL